MVADGTDPRIAPRLTEIVNLAYEEGEKGLWIDGAARTSMEEMVDLIGRGEIAAATMAGRVVGCVRVRRLAPRLAEFGMLAADPAQRGSGVGRALVRFAEDWARAEGIPVMQLELLVPVDGEHPVKEFLRTWYTRLGYRQISAGPLDQGYAELAAYLAVPGQMLRFHKEL
jgi:GNAT superfamily N-acetyltransferase